MLSLFYIITFQGFLSLNFIQKLIYLIGLPILFLGEILTFKREIKLIVTSPVIIYGVRKLGNKTIVYVGKTDYKNFETRKRHHIEKIYKKSHSNKNFAEFVVLCMYAIEFEILEVCGASQAREREYYWIQKLKSPNLTNIKDPRNPFRDLPKE